MTQKDMESIVSGISKLNGVLVVTVPDCLLYSAWQRDEDAWDAEVAGAYFGQLLTSGLDGLRSLEGWEGLSQITLELSSGRMVLRRTRDEGFVIAYLFEQDTPLGWIRMQVDRTFPRITSDLTTDEIHDMPDPFQDLEIEEPETEFDTESGFESQSESESAPASEPEPESKPGLALGADQPAATESAASADTDDAGAQSKGARLMKYLDENAPDTHAALLRVSLQTGLPLTLLRTPDSLSDEDYTKVEESVRLILGVEQLEL